MSTELVRYSIGEIECMAEAVAKSRLFPGVENAQSAMVLMLLCESEGLHPIQAMRRFHIIENRPSMRADAMQAEFQRHGGRVEWLCSTRDECRAVFSHPQHAPKGFEVHVTFKELDDAGITRSKYGVKDNWRKFPRQMLRARAVSEGVRAVDPGIVVGIYTPEEVSDFEPRDVPIETTARVVEPTPAREVADELMTQFNAARPKDRHQPVVTTAAELAEAGPSLPPKAPPKADPRRYRDRIFQACVSVNDFFRQTAEEEGFANVVVVNQFQVENHLATWALDHKPIDPGYLSDDQGKRDPEKVRNFLARWFEKHPAEFEGLVRVYCAEKLKVTLAANGIVLNDEEHAAEDESQDSDVIDVEMEEA